VSSRDSSLFLILAGGGAGFLIGVIYGGYASGFLGTLITLAAGYGISQGVNLVGFIQQYRATPVLTRDEKAIYNDEKKYFLRYRKTSGEGKVKECEGRVSVKGTRLTTQTGWEHPNGQRIVDIGDYNDLILFQLREPETDPSRGTLTERLVLFYSAGAIVGVGGGGNSPYKDVKDSMLIVRVSATHGRTPEPFEKKISDIIAEAVKQTYD
jgi:hypothetical protein